MLRFWSTAYVQHLEAEIVWLRDHAQAAQQRWEVAVAELVRLQTGGNANVHPRPLMATKEQEVGQELRDLMGDAEFSQAGT